MSKEHFFTELVDKIRLVDIMQSQTLAEIRGEKIDWDDHILLEEVYGFAHLFSKDHMYIQSLVYHMYEQVILHPKLIELSGARYYDLLEFFLTQYRETYIEQDIDNFFETHCFPVDVHIPLKVLKSIYSRITSPVAYDKYLGLLGIMKYHGYDDQFVAAIPFTKLFSLIITLDDEIRNKSFRMIDKIMSFYILDSSRLKQLKNELKPFLLSALKSDARKILWDTLVFMDRNLFFNWEEGSTQLAWICDKHVDEEIQEKAKKVFDEINS
ncbi:hypothetical protein GCM10022259_13820 [Aquimarina mytili]